MGNYISCTLSTPGSRHSRTIKVIFPGGEIKHFHDTIKAAELMLEKPNFFTVNARSLYIGGRFSALSADEELEFSSVYVMFPMKRLNSRVTAADMGALLVTANAAAKRACGGKVRILPESNNSNYDTNSDTKVDEIKGMDLQPEFMHRLSFCKSKKPLLETIAEEPVCSR